MRPARPLSVRLSVRLRPLAAAAALSLTALAPPAGAVDYYWAADGLSTTGLPSTITLNDTLTIGCWTWGCSAKYIDTAFLNNGTATAYDHVQFLYGNTWTNGWQLQLAGDVGLINAYAGGLFINESSGSLVKTAGTGTSTINISSLSRGGSILDAMSGRIEFSGGHATFDSGAILLANAGTAIAFTGGTASFADGVRFTGSGAYRIGTNASFGGTVAATDLAFTNGAYTGGDGAGGRATLASNATWSGEGSLQGAWTVAAGNTLQVSAAQGGTRYIYGHVVNEGTVNTDGHLHFLYGNTLDNRGTLNLQGDVGLINAYAGGTVLNRGTLRKSAGLGASGLVGLSFVNQGGLIDVQSGSLVFEGSQAFQHGTRFTGAGQVLVNTGATFGGHIESANLVLNGASYQGGDASDASATLHGQTRWAGGYLNGQWTLAADHTLGVQAAGTAKYIYGSVNNHGRINAADHLYFLYGNALNNEGVFDLQGDVGMVNAYAGGVFNNSGTLVKSAGTGVSYIQGMSGQHSGQVWVQQGALNFDGGNTTFSGSAVLNAAAGSQIAFNGGHASFADGVQLQGAGAYRVAGNSSVQGQIGAAQLTFGPGSHVGGDGAGGRATLASNATWSGESYLQGAWTVAAGNALQASAAEGGTRYIYGHLINEGTLNTDGHLHFLYGNTLDNRGTLNLQGDVGLINAYASGTVLNSGTVRKSTGTGVSSVLGLNFVNQGGLIDVQSGALVFEGSQAFQHGTRFTGGGQVLVNTSASFSGQLQSANLVLNGASYQGADAGATLRGQTQWTGGYLTGQWTLAADHTLGVQAGAAKYVYGSVNNQGRVNAGDHLYFVYGNVLNNEGVFDLQGDVGLVNAYAGGVFNNSGTLVKSAGAGVSDLSTVQFNSSGTVDVQTGTLRLGGVFYNQGVLKGLGRVEATQIVNTGHLAPGASPGTLTLGAALTLDSAGVLDMELHSSTQHDQLNVAGDVVLGGTLALSCWNACHFSAGSQLLLLDGQGLLRGGFDQVTLAGFAPGTFSVVVDSANADVWLNVVQNVAAVPEPATTALWLAGLLGVGLAARRRTR